MLWNLWFGRKTNHIECFEENILPLFGKKGPSVDIKRAESILEDQKCLEVVGSGDPHEEFGKIRRFIEMINPLDPDLLVFDGDYLAEPAYLKVSEDLDAISQQSVQLLVKVFEKLLEVKPKTLFASGNYEIFGSAYDAVQTIGSDHLFDIGCNKKLDPQVDHVHYEDVYMGIDTHHTTWPGNTLKKGDFTLIGIEG